MRWFTTTLLCFGAAFARLEAQAQILRAPHTYGEQMEEKRRYTVGNDFGVERGGNMTSKENRKEWALTKPTTRPPHAVSGAEWTGRALTKHKKEARTTPTTRPSHYVNGARWAESELEDEQASKEKEEEEDQGYGAKASRRRRETKRAAKRESRRNRRVLPKPMTRPPHAVSGAEWTGGAPKEKTRRTLTDPTTRSSHVVNGAEWTGGGPTRKKTKDQKGKESEEAE